MSSPVVHLELHTGDLSRATAFYAALCGWRSEQVETAAGSYQALGLGSAVSGGVVECPAPRSLWLPYVALPSIQSDLGFSQSSLAWVVNAYLIAFGGLLLLAGRLGDLISRRGVFLTGLGVFTLASLACGASQSQEMLVAARFIQGIGGA